MTGPHNGHAHCMLCGERNPWSLGLNFHAGEDGTVSARVQSHSRLQGYDGILHGGMIAALLDAAMTHCLFYHGVQALTGDLHVRFLEPIPCEALLDLHAKIESMSPPLYRVQAMLVCDGKVMARAEAKFIQRKP